MSSTEWRERRPHDLSARSRTEMNTMLPRMVDNLAYAVWFGATVVADAIRYHGDQQVEAAKNRRTRGE